MISLQFISQEVTEETEVLFRIDLSVVSVSSCQVLPMRPTP